MYQRQRLFFGWLPRANVIRYIKTQCIEEEKARIPQIVKQWEIANRKFASMSKDQTGLPDTIEIKEIEDAYKPKLQRIAEDVFFKRTFSRLPTEFKIVEIDKLIAWQNRVVLDYIDQLVEKYPKQPTMENLIDICLSVGKEYPPVAELQVGPNTYVYSSESTDFRFLEAIPKPLEQVDLKASSSGGIPVAGILLFVGYGVASMNVLSVGKRLILNNGFHRAYALRSIGVTHIPIVVQIVRNPELEFSPNYHGLPRSFLLKNPRPPVMRDYLDPSLTIEVKAKARRRSVKISWVPEAIDVPI